MSDDFDGFLQELVVVFASTLAKNMRLFMIAELSGPLSHARDASLVTRGRSHLGAPAWPTVLAMSDTTPTDRRPTTSLVAQPVQQLVHSTTCCNQP